MWCSHCQHEVPVLATPGEGPAQRCPRCKRRLGSEKPVPAVAAPASAKENAAFTLSLTGMPVSLDDWELEDDIRATKRILMLVRAGEPRLVPKVNWPERPIEAIPVPAPTPAPAVIAAAPAVAPIPLPAPRPEPRPEPPARSFVPPARPLPIRPAAPPPSRYRPAASPPPESPKASGAGWVILSLGLMAFVCGGVLVAWSFAANRPDLWRLGLPITFAGQAGLLLGLVLQLDGLWQTSRRTSETLDELDDELAEIKHATTMLSTTHSAPAQSFYAHYSSGASPQLLLADLKGQLDLLATRLGDQKRAA